ncbi:MAG: hypothetical protein DHS20C15_12460 [Planctomycetota bacterium]|nr:MAG: hypothetical protein DHS20C15_12460 [Planctomycetota bacterium]
MSAGKLWIVGVVLLVGAAWFVFRGEPRAPDTVAPPLDRNSPAAERAPELPEALDEQVQVGDVPEPRSAVEPELISPSVERLAREFLIVEVVTKGDELPVQGARVSVSTWGRTIESDDDSESELSVVKGVTDADGRCELAPVIGKLSITVAVPGAHFGTAAHSHHFEELRAGTPEADAPRTDDVAAVVRVEVAALTEVRGRVIDPAGKPLQGVRVSNRVSDFLNSEPTLTDAEGLFRFRHWEVDMGSSLDFVRAGYGREHRRLIVRPDGKWYLIDDGFDPRAASSEGVFLEVVMSPQRVIRGRVVDSAGSGVADIAVLASGMIRTEMFGTPDEARTRTHDDGSFVLEGTRVDVGYLVRADAPERGVAMQYAFAGEVEIDLGDLELVELVALSGRFVDRSGQPAGGASFELNVTDLTDFDDDLARATLDHEPGSRLARQSVDADGRFEVRAPPIAGLDLVVRVGSFIALRVAPDLSRGSLDLGDLQIEQDAQRVHGVLLDAEGAPVAGAHLSVGRGPDQSLAVLQTATDGSFDGWIFAARAKRLVIEQLSAGAWVAQTWTLPVSEFPATLSLDAAAR